MGSWRIFRDSQRYNRKEGRFPKYVEAVKRSLASHGFREPFQLDEDLGQQDRLTIWIEYLDYEHWKQDKALRTVQRHQLQYDEAWKDLVDSQVLRPFETQELICNIESAFQRAGEEDRAKKAVESVKSAVTLRSKATTGVSVTTSARESSIRQSSSNRTKSVVKTQARVNQDDKVRARKKGIQDENSRILPSFGSRPLRRSTRTRKRPERFQ